MEIKIYDCINPGFSENCLETFESYAALDSIENTLCSVCATKFINQLNNFMPEPKSHLNIGSRLKCIKPVGNFEKDEICFCTNFGFLTVIVRKKYQNSIFAKNYSKKNFMVWYKPFGSKIGKWCKII